MILKKLRAFFLLDIILSVAICSVSALISLGLLSIAISHVERFTDIGDTWQKGTRLLLVLESRLVNVGLGLPKNIPVRDIFRSGATTPLPNWNSVIEILDFADNPVPFQDIDGDEVSRGAHLRVLSTTTSWSGIDLASIRVASADFEWQPGKSIELAIMKPPRMILSGSAADASLLSSWLTIPSLGIPFIYEKSVAVNGSTQGSLTARNAAETAEWGGVDMLFAFRFAYFFAAENAFFIRDSDKRDRLGDTPSKYPVESGIIAACFEFNKTKKILSAWLLFSGSHGNPSAYPAWAPLPAGVQLKNSTAISGSWHIKNF